MPVKFIQHGAAIDHVPTADLPAGSVVVLEDLVAVTKRTIRAGEFGVLHVEGVFEFPKPTGSGKAIPLGKTVYWHPGTCEVRTSGNGGAKLLGKSVQETGDDDATIRIRLGAG